AEDGLRDFHVTGVQTCALPICDGTHCIGKLIEAQSRRRQSATSGESCIPMDDETLRCLQEAGFDYDSILPCGQHLTVRRTANLRSEERRVGKEWRPRWATETQP